MDVSNSSATRLVHISERLVSGKSLRRANTIGELFFLSPSHFVGQQIGKCLSHYLLFYRRTGTHLCLRVDTHGYIKELLIEEWHTSLHTPCRQTLVGTETVIEIKLENSSLTKTIIYLLYNYDWQESRRLTCFVALSFSYSSSLHARRCRDLPPQFSCLHVDRQSC